MALPPTTPQGLIRDSESINEWANSEEDTLINRAGSERLTLKGVVESATTGNPAVGAAQQAIDAKNTSVAAAASASSSASQAEIFAEAAATASNTYSSSSDGQSDSVLSDGDYFWVVSSADEEVLELWRKGASSPTNTGKTLIEASYSIESRSSASASVAESTANPNLLDSRQAGCLVGPFRTDLGGAETVVYNGKNCVRLFDTVDNGILSDWVIPADEIPVGESVTVSVVVEFAEIGSTSSLQIREFWQNFSTLETTSVTIIPNGNGVDRATKFTLTATRQNANTRFIGLRLVLNKRSVDDSRSVYVHSLSIAKGSSTQALASNKGRTVSSANLQKDAVTTKSAKFIGKSVNLFDKTKALPNTRLDQSTGEVISQGSQATSDFIEVERYKELYANAEVRWWEYDEFKKPLRTSLSENITPGALTVYVRVAGLPVWASLTGEGVFILNEGTSSAINRFEDFYNAVDENILDYGYERTRNLIDTRDLIEGFILGQTNGTTNSNPDNAVTPYIRVEADRTVENPVDGVTIYVGFYRQDKSFISGSLVTINGGENTTTPSDAYYFRARATISSGNSRAMHLQYVNSNKYYEDGRITDTDRLNYPKLAPKNILMPNLYNDYYKLTSAPITDIIADGRSVSALYSRYQSLIDAHPEYLTKEVLGLDESGTYEVWKISAKLDQFESPSDKQIKKLIFIAGIHGDEEVCIRATLAFLHDLCENWKTNPALRWVRFNTNIEFIPLANPWGFPEYSRQNSNGIDLNRNFEPNFTVGTPGTQTYGGTEPLSELESQYIDNLLASNTDAIAFWDYHNMTAATPDMLIWFAQNTREAFTAFDDVIARELISQVTQDYQVNRGSSFNGWHGYVSGSYEPMSRAQAGHVYGIPSATFETSRTVPGLATDTPVDIVEVSTEALGNLLIGTYRAEGMYK